MNYEAEITALKARLDAMENEFVLLYESVNKRVDDIHEHRSQALTVWGIVVAVIIGGIQILIALFSK